MVILAWYIASTTRMILGWMELIEIPEWMEWMQRIGWMIAPLCLGRAGQDNSVSGVRDEVRRRGYLDVCQLSTLALQLLSF